MEVPFLFPSSKFLLHGEIWGVGAWVFSGNERQVLAIAESDGSVLHYPYSVLIDQAEKAP